MQVLSSALVVLSFALATLVPAANAQTDSAVEDAYRAKKISEAQFTILLDAISPDANEEKWRQTPWLPSIWEGRKLAEKKHQPIFLWAMNGDPLGCV